MKTRKPALFLALILTLSQFACADNPGAGTGKTDDSANPPQSTDEVSTEAGIPEMPDKKLSGFELHVGKPVQEKILWSNVSFATAEENGEVLNDAIYSRNVRTCDKYGFSITDTELDDPLSVLQKQCLSDDSDYDLFLVPLNKMNASTGKEYLVDFHTVPNLDLGGDWWDQDMLRDLDMGGGQFFMNGDVIFSVYDCLRVIMYSKGLAEDLDMDGFYDMVRSGKWTVDRMYELMSAAANDVNSDGKFDYQDRFGLLYNNNSFYACMTAQDVKLVSTDGELGFGSERFVKAYENILKLFDRSLVFNYNNDKYPGLTAREAIVTLFDNRQALFFENGMSAAAQYMRDVKNVDFGFLPLPKLDEDQDKYYSFVSTSAPVLTIPKTNGERLDNTGFALEALCRASSETVVPVYFETCFSAKYTRDEESYEMILLATDSRMYDPGIIYNYGKINSAIVDAAKAGDEAIMSKLESIKDAVLSDYNKSVGKE